LPAPFGPKRPTASPRRRRSETFRTTRLPLKLLPMPLATRPSDGSTSRGRCICITRCSNSEVVIRSIFPAIESRLSYVAIVLCGLADQPIGSCQASRAQPGFLIGRINLSVTNSCLDIKDVLPLSVGNQHTADASTGLVRQQTAVACLEIHFGAPALHGAFAIGYRDIANQRGVFGCRQIDKCIA